MKRGVIIFIVLTFLALGGYLYYQKLQNTVTPANAPVLKDNEDNSPELASQVVVQDLANVWDVGFLPDETMLFTERVGTISKMEDNRKVVIHAIDDIYVVGEGGLMGLTIDPEFAQNRFIYACYNTPQDIRVSRWKVNSEVSSLEDQTDIITGMPNNTTTFRGRHSGCRPRFDNQKNLWVGTGDAAIGTNPQNPKSLGGKILRVDREGNGIEGNLGAPFDKRIFSYGHRNTQGIALFTAPKGNIYGYSVEHGPDRDDEVNLLASGNFGWNPMPGYNESVPMTDKKAYPDAVEELWSSGDSTIAPSGATIIAGDKWLGYRGRLVMAVLKNRHIRVLQFDAGGHKVIDERELFKGDFGRIRSVVMGPRDDMFVTTDNGIGQDKIIRIAPKL